MAESKLKIVDQVKTSLVEISYKDEVKGIETYGRLFVNDDLHMEFEGNNVEESARVFFEEYLKPMCEEYFRKLRLGAENKT